MLIGVTALCYLEWKRRNAIGYTQLVNEVRDFSICVKWFMDVCMYVYHQSKEVWRVCGLSRLQQSQTSNTAKGIYYTTTTYPSLQFAPHVLIHSYYDTFT